MKIHEFQAKRVLAGFGVPVPRGETAETPAEARAAAETLGGPVLVKAQVLSGGRGRAGGVLRAAAPAEAAAAAARLLGRALVTEQTGPEGRLVRRVLVEEALEAARELYASVVLDSRAERLALLVSARGGTDIEVLAAADPEAVGRHVLPPSGGLPESQAKSAASALGLPDAAARRAASLFQDLARAVQSTDASLAEINPLVLTAAGDLVAADAKMDFDDNGLYRHPDIRGLRDPDESSPEERAAAAAGLSYVKLDGDIGCLVNGAGLAMATMDLVRLFGGRPANFLDIGGGVSEQAVAQAFGLIASGPGARAALVNVFGGIVRCDLVARGIVRAARERGVRVPVVARLEGTNAELGRGVLAGSGLPFVWASDMETAAREAVRLARESGGRP